MGTSNSSDYFDNSHSENFSISAQEQMVKRALLTPDEVRRLAKDQALLFSPGLPAIQANRINYLNDPYFAGRYDTNPMHGGHS